jgi:hypothetical protein
MSPVFKDMFSIAAEAIDCDSRTQSSQPPLKLTESSAVMEALLEHIDPKSKRNLKIDPDNIFELLEAARKYQISTITEWFREEAVLRQRDVSSGKSVLSDSFQSMHPDLALQCAIRFAFPMIGRRVLRQLAGSKPQLKSTDMQSAVYLYHFKLWETHVQRYQSYISTLLEDMRGRKSNQDTCGSCRNFLSGWFLDMERAIMVNPRWHTFSLAYESKVTCHLHSCGSPSSWPNHYRDLWDVWKKEAMKLENELPQWPFDNPSTNSS